VSSFRLKLFVYFLLVAVLPVAAASWTVSKVEARAHVRATDARLQAELRAALVAYEQEVQAASARALGRTLPGRRAAPDARRRVTLVGHHGSIGSVEVFVPLDRALLRRVARDAVIAAGDRLELVRRRSGHRVEVELPDAPGYALAVVTARRGAGDVAGTWLTAGLLATLLLVALVAFVEARAIVRTIRSLVGATNDLARGDLDRRVEVRGRDELALLGRAFNSMAGELAMRLEELETERGRLREVLSEFGAALAATHDFEELLRVVVETAVEATGAAGGTFVGDDGTFVGSGDHDTEGERVELPLAGPNAHFGVLTLVGVDRRDDLDTASSLVAQAVVALENARLHRIVAEQALSDELTGLANRRRCEEALAAEIARVRRFGGSFTVVLADLDGFKQLNDAHGHAAGDLVLREFARLIQDTVRASDLAGRWGGEEFVLLLTGTDLAGALDIAERVRAGLERRTILASDGAQLHVTASFGVSTFEEDADVVAAADAALYVAKWGGKNRVVPASQGRSSARKRGSTACGSGYSR
jgi:diguanylate cyclase (GGDEF)-like protein